MQWLLTALLAFLPAVALSLVSSRVSVADARSLGTFHALVFTDREKPDVFVHVKDLRVNDSITDESGDQFFVLDTDEGTFQLPFETVAEVELTRFRGMVLLDTASYDARVVLPLQGVRRGTMKLRSLKGEVGKSPWHLLLMMREQPAERLHRILFLRHER